MPQTPSAQRFRFGVFEADAATGELRRNGLRIRLPAQPFQVLLLLLDRPGELLTREEICRQLWPDGTFVDYDHSVNSAVNRLREALGDRAGSPRYVETLARRGYRFVAPVERLGFFERGAQAGIAEPGPALNPDSAALPDPSPAEPSPPLSRPFEPEALSASVFDRYLAAPEDLPAVAPPIVRVLFLALQGMYVSFYISALANLAEIGELLSPLAFSTALFYATLVSAAVLIPVRTFLLCAVLFRAPHLRTRYLQLWPFLLAVDIVWAVSPLLLLHHISFGLALACVPFLVYSPFAQRSLVLMGAGARTVAA